MLRNGLSIIIPTYNREKQLYNQLKLIFESNINLIEEIVIIDNHSDYDILNLVASFNSNKIRLVRQPFNVKVHNNIAFCFYYVKTEWFWLLSDDDEILDNAIENIKEEIEEIPSDVGMIKFARTNSSQKNYIANNLESFIDYYINEKIIRRGDLVFMSTNVYNTIKLKDYLGFAFEYAYTYVPQIVPIIKGLDDKKVSIKFSDVCIVKYLPPREGNYSFATVGKGISTFSHIPLNLSKSYRLKFLNIIMSINYRSMINFSLKFENTKDFRIIYNNIYRYYLPIYIRFFVEIFILAMNYKMIRAVLFTLYKLYKRIK
ncbi:MAG: glycosyltransferase family 2 protein [Bacteroidales bacterium]|nr:glycosyltransferase family 2 protein [Bacteroidales bacterium]